MQNGDPEAGRDGFFDCAVVAQFEPGLELRSLFAKEFFQGEPRAGANFALDENLSRQTRDWDSLGPG